MVMFQSEPMTPCVLSAVPVSLVDPFKRDLSGMELLGQTPFIELKSGKTLWEVSCFLLRLRLADTLCGKWMLVSGRYVYMTHGLK